MGGLVISDYILQYMHLVRNSGIEFTKIQQDSIGLTIGLKSEVDILGNKIVWNSDLGATEID